MIRGMFRWRRMILSGRLQHRDDTRFHVASGSSARAHCCRRGVITGLGELRGFDHRRIANGRSSWSTGVACRGRSHRPRHPVAWRHHMAWQARAVLRPAHYPLVSANSPVLRRGYFRYRVDRERVGKGDGAGEVAESGLRYTRTCRGYALANAGHDTRAIQAWMGHRTSSTRSVIRSSRRSVQGFLALVTRDGSFEFYEPYLRRSIYGFKKKQLQLAASSARGIEFMQKQVSVKLPQGSQMATLTLGIEATLRNVG